MENRKVRKKQEGGGLTEIWSASRAWRRPNDQARTAVAYISLESTHVIFSSENQNDWAMTSTHVCLA